MIFNFIHNYKFTTGFTHDEGNIDVIDEVKLLGTIITNDLKWSKNTDYLVRKANARMRLLYIIVELNAPIEDMVKIHMNYIRSYSNNPVLSGSQVLRKKTQKT